MSIWDIVLVCRKQMCLFVATVHRSLRRKLKVIVLWVFWTQTRDASIFLICHMQQKINNYNRLFQLYWDSAQWEQALTGQARTTQVALPALGFKGVEGTGWLRILFSGLFMKLPGEQMPTLGSRCQQIFCCWLRKTQAQPCTLPRTCFCGMLIGSFQFTSPLDPHRDARK